MERQKTTAPTIDLILTAAERVALRDGVLRLTVEAVAREAKLSKGGVLYHFATKESLIQAMLDRLIQYCEQEIDAAPAERCSARTLDTGLCAEDAGALNTLSRRSGLPQI